nr:MAG TPA: hypothetical protein [Caudoviricetes sp.]
MVMSSSEDILTYEKRYILSEPMTRKPAYE